MRLRQAAVQAAGGSLTLTRPVAAPDAATALLALLKHPLTATGRGRWARRAHLLRTRELELHLRRNGPAFPDGAALRAWGERPRWGAVLSAGFVAGVAANLITRGASAGAILYGLANLIEVGLAVSLLRRSGEREGILHTTGAVLRFILVAGLVAPAVSAVPGSLTAFALYGEPLPKAFATWVASDGLGLLVFTPFLSTVVRGAFVGLSAETTRSDMTRSVMEGVAFSMRACQEAGGGVKGEGPLIAVGAGSRSAAWLQILADVLGRDIVLPASGDFGAAFGAARLGLCAAESASPDDVMTMPPVASRFSPREGPASSFEAAYRRYRLAYPIIRSLMV